jgi:hypothetical protein
LSYLQVCKQFIALLLFDSSFNLLPDLSKGTFKIIPPGIQIGPASISKPVLLH